MNEAKAKRVVVERFDLNRIDAEPSDQQLGSLMAAVAEEARERSATARQAILLQLRAEIAAARKRQNKE